MVPSPQTLTFKCSVCPFSSTNESSHFSPPRSSPPSSFTRISTAASLLTSLLLPLLRIISFQHTWCYYTCITSCHSLAQTFQWLPSSFRGNKFKALWWPTVLCYVTIHYLFASFPTILLPSASDIHHFTLLHCPKHIIFPCPTYNPTLYLEAKIKILIKSTNGFYKLNIFICCAWFVFLLKSVCPSGVLEF